MTFPGGALPGAGQGQQQGGQQFAPQQQPQGPTQPHLNLPASDTVVHPYPNFAQPQGQQPNQVIDPRQQQFVQQPQQQFAPPVQQQGGQFPFLQQPQQQAPRQPDASYQIDANGRVWGPGVPQQLQGATVQQIQMALGINGQGGFAQSGQPVQPQRQFQQQLPQPRFNGQQLPQQQFQPQQQNPQQFGGQNGSAAAQVGAGQQQQVQQPPQAQQQRPSFWQQPEDAIARIVDQRVAPFVQAEQARAIETARNTVASQYAEFAQFGEEVQRRLDGVSPEILMNPQAWAMVLQQVVGEQYLQSRRGGPQQQQRFSPAAQQQAPQGWQPYPAQQQAQRQAPGLGDFFTESPSGQFAPTQNAATQLSAAQMEVARRFNLTPEQYLQGMGAKY